MDSIAVRRVRGAFFALGLLLGALSACGPAGGGGGRDRGPPVRDVVLITVDTWRGDHFDTARAGTPLTPELAAFADGGVRFTTAHSVSSETAPGTAGFLTGLTPRRSGVLVNTHMLPAEVPTLAALLAGHGVATTGVVANPVLGPGSGFERGFGAYRLVPPGPEGSSPKARAPAVTDAALAAFDALPEDAEGRFLWVHYLDPHGPYLPPPELRELFPLDGFEAPRDIPFLEGSSGFGGIPVYQRSPLLTPTHDGRDYLARYAAEVRSTDREIGRLLDGLEARGVLDRAMVIVTADHGEAMADDHGYYFSHANGLTQDQIHVPMVVRCPGCPSGKTVERSVSTVDVVPTVLARLGLPGPPGVDLDGVDLLAPAPDAPRIVFSQRGRERSVRRGDWKLILGFGEPRRLYDLASDPGERHDLATRRPRIARSLGDEIRRLRELPVLARAEHRSLDSPEEKRRLEALGYF